MQANTPPSASSASFSLMNLVQHTPLMCSVAIPAYYCLGWAYKIGLMARIDRIAIEVLCHFVGYMGVGIWMPIVHWYAAWCVRIIVGSLCGLLYTVIEKVAKSCYRIYCENQARNGKSQTGRKSLPV